ncbi:g13555 [Coccomyxa viridis]|uniref:G13555 protein n=1 Tax=Coccomyxa viridis TaxID=1274662 RepID=A0ABP1GDC5_9CHLO
MPVELGKGAAYPSSHGYPLRQSTRGAVHPQNGGTKFTDLDAAAGLRALQKRIHLVPGAVHEFLQAGGISAAVTILCSQPLHANLRDAAVTLLQAVLQKLPDEASSAFMEARGMQAAVYLLGNSACQHSRSMASDGLSTARAAAALLEAVLDAAPQSASQAFHDAGGLLTVRMCITCAKLGKPHELEVAEAALCVLHALLVRIRLRADTKRVLCHAVIAADLHQPLLALLHIHPTSMGSSKAVECLAALAETNAANVRVLAKDGCVAALLSVIGHADAASKSARSGVVLLQFLAQHQASVRAGLATKDALPVLIRVLAAVESQDPISTDAISSILRMLVPQPDELGCREGKRACHWAAFFGIAALLQDLVEQHPNLEAKDRRGNTALHLAAARNYLSCVELLLEGGADALARNFAGLQPHKLASPGSPAWEQLLEHLEWRSCLDEPRLCHFLPSELTSLPAMEQEWQGPAKCYFLPLSGKLRLESADAPQQTPPTAKSWIKRTLSGGVPAVEQALASDANRSGCLICEFAVPAQTQIDEIDSHTLGLTLIDFEGREGVIKLPCPVEKLLIRVEEPSDQTAADLAAALHLFIRHHHSGQAEHQSSQDNSLQGADVERSGASSNQLSKAWLQHPSDASTLGAQQAAAKNHVAVVSHVHEDAVSSRTLGSTGADNATPQATSEQQGSEADATDHGSSKQRQPGRAELRDVPASCEVLESSRQEQPHHACSPFARGLQKEIPGMPTCHTFSTSCEQALPQPQTQGPGKRRARRAPPPPPPPPMPDTPRKAHNPLATAAAIQAVDQTRQQQQALAKTIVYAPHEASVATKVCELEKQIGRGRSHGPGVRGSAVVTQEDASLPFVRHMSEHLMWQSDLRACSDMQRQRSHSDPTAGKVASPPTPGLCAKEVASSPAEKSTTYGPIADHNRLSRGESGSRTLPAEKVSTGSEVFGIVANGSAASTQIRHVQPDADQPAIGSITLPRKPFAYGPRGAAIGSSVACDMAGSDRQVERGWSAADPRFTSPQRMIEAARVQARLGQGRHGLAMDPRFA